VRDVYEVLMEKESDLQRVCREVEALRLAVRLLIESEEPPADAAFQWSDIETDDTEPGRTVRVSMRLKRMAAPLLAAFVR
jgi:hypothetical protein